MGIGVYGDGGGFNGGVDVDLVVFLEGLFLGDGLIEVLGEVLELGK